MILGDPALDLTDRPIDGLGDRVAVYTGVRDDRDAPERVVLMAMRDGNLGILLTAWGADGSIVMSVEGAARLMVAAEPGEASITVTAGEAIGGTFDLMADRTDADVQRGLAPIWDYDLLLNGGDEPINPVESYHATPPGSDGRRQAGAAGSRACPEDQRLRWRRDFAVVESVDHTSSAAP